MNIVTAIDSVIEKFTRLLSGLGGILMAVMTCFVFVDVTCRYIFKTPVVISNEMTNILFPWIVALSAVSIARNNGNTALTFIKEKFHGAFRHCLEILVYLVMIYFSTMMTKAAWLLCYQLRREILALTRVSKVAVYGSMLICFGGITLVVTWNLIKYIYTEVLKLGGEAR
ncbi:MAG: TRAP transporter small permease [Acidithiobacillus sp.]|nr:TRAP transporter small permease [Oscillospiraceae bacterium MB24-C1]